MQSGQSPWVPAVQHAPQQGPLTCTPEPSACRVDVQPEGMVGVQRSRCGVSRIVLRSSGMGGNHGGGVPVWVLVLALLITICAVVIGGPLLS